MQGKQLIFLLIFLLGNAARMVYSSEPVHRGKSAFQHAKFHKTYKQLRQADMHGSEEDSFPDLFFETGTEDEQQSIKKKLKACSMVIMLHRILTPVHTYYIAAAGDRSIAGARPTQPLLQVFRI